MRIVADTNVLVSGLLNPYGAPAEIVRLIASGGIGLYYDARILSEYREVLARAEFEFDVDRVDALLEQIQATGNVVAARPLLKRLRDPDDEPFLEVALAGNARCLVTGNMKHYPASKRQGMTVLSPREFLERFREELSAPPKP